MKGDENRVCVEIDVSADIDLQKLKRNFYTTSSCGVCGKSSIDAIRTTANFLKPNKENIPDFRVSFNTIYKLPDLLRENQNVFESTGGLHASALFDSEGNFLLLREDVGRHNALDKLIGAAMKENMLPLHHFILLLSGRASFELIQKAIMAGIKIVAAIGAPSSLAVESTKEFDMTLIGFLRGESFNIYCGEERIDGI